MWERLPSLDSEMKARIPERGTRQLRKGRLSQKESYYFITTCTCNKQRLFVDEHSVRIVFDALDWLEQSGFIEVHFCIVMPDHLHLVMQLVGEKSLSDVVKSLKQFTSRRLRQVRRLEVPVWQEQFYDHMLRRDESLIETIRYCWFNPVRAGLVKYPNDYPYWKSKYKLD